DLGRLLKGVVEDHSARLERQQLTLVLDLPKDPVWVDGDPARLLQVFDNLLSHAVKFTHAGGHVGIRVEPEDNSALVSFEDDGAGLAPGLLPRVFEPFRQARQSIDRSLGGLGLGLSLVRGLVELHGGSVTAESAGPERGSTFTLKLPLAEHGG